MERFSSYSLPQRRKSLFSRLTSLEDPGGATSLQLRTTGLHAGLSISLSHSLLPSFPPLPNPSLINYMNCSTGLKPYFLRVSQENNRHKIILRDFQLISINNLKTVSTFVKLSQLIISLQRKPEEESPRKDDAKKAKQEPEVNGGSGDTISTGTEVAENMEEEVGS